VLEYIPEDIFFDFARDVSPRLLGAGERFVGYEDTSTGRTSVGDGAYLEDCIVGHDYDVWPARPYVAAR